MSRNHAPKHAAIAAVFAPLLALASAAFGQGFPNRPISMVYPFPGGTNQEIAVRALTTEAAKTLGQPVVWDIRPGALNRLGVIALRTAKPDGHFLTLAPNTLLVAVQIADPELKFEPGKDYLPVVMTNDYPVALIVNPQVPFRSVKGLVDYAKANPMKLNAVGGSATLDLFWGMLEHATGIKMTHIPYKASSASLPDLVAGRVDIVLQILTAKPFLDDGRLVALATTGKERWQPFGNLPTFIESGVPISLTTYMTLVTTPTAPRDAIAKVNQAVRGAQKAPEVVGLMEKAGFYSTAPLNYSPDELLRLLRSEIETWTPVIRGAGIQVQ